MLGSQRSANVLREERQVKLPAMRLPAVTSSAFLRPLGVG